MVGVECGLEKADGDECGWVIAWARGVAWGAASGESQSDWRPWWPSSLEMLRWHRRVPGMLETLSWSCVCPG